MKLVKVGPNDYVNIESITMIQVYSQESAFRVNSSAMLYIVRPPYLDRFMEAITECGDL